MVLALVLACGGEQVGMSAGSSADYAGRSELHAEFGPDGDTGSTPWLLRLDGDAWEARDGLAWSDAAVMGAWTASISDGLWLDDGTDRTQLLPDRLVKGESGDGVSVVSLGEVDTWYGTFDDAVIVEVSDGRWAGEQAFARDFGLVIWTLDGETRELVYYE